ncbi:response regulator transcription factor [Leucobacter chromiiresistens]|uniref:Transcriptional regulator n=1 Tax=Leucobacter chromiiresistens TaxID=1079994 RepID=A0A147EPM8_9MICO|nr:response regulator transcription factor [Leucobacter chromiiresistens]KTR86347.1 transcriptional regulator [Leucobacter chromiiresistens]
MSYEHRRIPAPAQHPLHRADGAPIRAVVVDDEESLTEVISMALRYEGWQVRVARDGQEGLATIREFRPDVVVLDVMMPFVDGLSVVSRIRADGLFMPVLLLTAMDAVEDRVMGLAVGGDDYLTKPFSLDELVARLRALIRRSNLALAVVGDAALSVGDLVLDEATFECSRGGEHISLTATELRLLAFLMRNAGQVLSKAHILAEVWETGFDERTSIVELYISYLRKKIDALGPAMIHTIHGVGYTLRSAS